jgi:hypothetical protein
MGRIKRAGIAALAVCGAAAVATVATQPAAAAGGSKPPLTRGYATFAPGSVTTRCTETGPAAVTFAFAWDATKLIGAYHVQAVLTVTRASDGSVVLVKHAPASIPAGAAGTYRHTFGLPGGVRGKNATLTLSTTQGAAYDYVRTSHEIRCADPSYAPQLPKIVQSHAKCAHFMTIIYDNTNGKQTWRFTYTYRPGDSSPGDVVIKPGEIVHSRVTGLAKDTPPWLIVRMRTGSGAQRSAAVLAEAYRSRLSADC